MSEIARRDIGDPAMHRACVAAIAFSILWSLGLGATDDVPEVSAQVPPVEEVLVEAPEPRYVAPTLRDRIGRVWVPVMINGQGPFRLVLDTGATSSAIVKSVADRLKLTLDPASALRLQGATGEATVPYVYAEQMEVGDLLISRTRLPIVPDVFGGAEGVLGTQGLADKRVHMDFRHDLIEINYARGKPRPTDVSIVKFELARGRLTTFTVMIGGVRTKAIIDTGAQQTIGNNRLRELLLLRKRKAEDADVIGVTLDVTQGESIGVPPIALGSVEVRNLHITFGEMPIFAYWQLTREPALLIGMDMIGTLETFTIDYKRRELYLRARR
jgi:predicted aspartyl protease